MHAIPAIDGDLLKNIVFVAVALLAWGVKIAVERKEARAGRKPRTSSGERTRSRPADEVDVVVERRPLPPTLRPKPRRRPSPPPVRPPEPPARDSVRPEHRPATAGARKLGGLSERALEVGLSGRLADFDVQAPMPGARRRKRRATGLSRLGVPPGRRPRDLLRAGILWSEVLGVPRAVSGPHRSPAAKRLRP